jgi:hypothetical protein
LPKPKVRFIGASDSDSEPEKAKTDSVIVDISESNRLLKPIVSTEAITSVKLVDFSAEESSNTGTPESPVAPNLKLKLRKRSSLLTTKRMEKKTKVHTAEPEERKFSGAASEHSVATATSTAAGIRRVMLNTQRKLEPGLARFRRLYVLLLLVVHRDSVCRFVMVIAKQK